MRVEGHLTPFRYLLGTIDGSGTDSILLGPKIQGIITDIDVTIFTASSATQAKVALQNNLISSLAAAGFPSGYPVSINYRGLYIPIYQNETLEIETDGLPGDITGYSISGYLYSVQAAYGIDGGTGT